MEDTGQHNIKKVQITKMMHIIMGMLLAILEIIIIINLHLINTKMQRMIKLQEAALRVRKRIKNRILWWRLKSLLKR